MQATLQCYETKSVLDFLAGEGLAVEKQGMTEDGAFFQLWINKNSTKFATTESLPNGGTCFLSNGKELETIPWKLKEKVAPPADKEPRA